MKRRTFVHTLGAAAAGAAIAPLRWGVNKRLSRIGLELYAVRKAMAKDPERTLAAVRAMGYSDVELLWSFDNFGRTPAQVAATLKNEGLRAPSAHVSPLILFVGWERSLDTAKQLGHDYLIVPDFGNDTTHTLDDWREWADLFNSAGAIRLPKPTGRQQCARPPDRRRQRQRHRGQLEGPGRRHPPGADAPDRAGRFGGTRRGRLLLGRLIRRIQRPGSLR